jgi:hypothetical protein
MRAEAVQRTVGQVPGHHAAAGPVLVHDEVEGEILDEELRIVLQGLLIERVDDGMAGAVGGSASALRHRLAIVDRVAAERPLIDLAVGGARERHAVMLELDHRRDGIAAHIFDRILVTQPVRPLDRVVHMPAPVVVTHVAECRADPALSCDRMAARREHLGDARGLQAFDGHAESGAEAGTAGTDDHDVIGVVDDRVRDCHSLASLRRRCAGPRRCRPRRAPNTRISAPPG